MEEGSPNRPWEKEGAGVTRARMYTSRFASKQIARNRLISFANGELGAEMVPFPNGPYSFPCPLGIQGHSKASPSASGELRIFPACFIPSPKGKTSTRSLAGMNSKHKYIHKFRAGRRGEYLPVIGKEKLGGPRAINHICAVFVRFIAWTRWHFQDFRRRKAYKRSYSKATYNACKY